MNRPNSRIVIPNVAAPVPSIARLAVALSTALILGCASSPCPPFQAAWYLIDDPPPPSAGSAASSSFGLVTKSTIVLALLSQGKKSSTLDRVIVNPDGDGGGQLMLESLQPLIPGELRLFPVGTQLGKCRLPVAVELQCGSDGPARTVAVSESLPNYLNPAWIDFCQPPQSGVR